VGSNGPTTTAKSGSGGGTLPQTGSGSDMLLMLGLGLVLGGGIFVAMGRRPEEA
jgi:LPXTG-motif cell wall-anchored protein